MERVRDVVVIGAGHAGLVVSYRLAQAGFDHVVLERGEIGQTWRTQRWDSFQLNTPSWRSWLPGSTFARDDPDAFMAMPQWLDGLDGYAHQHRLPVQTHCAVTAVERDGPSAFRISTSAGELRSRAVVVASGGQNVARRPAAMGELAGTVEVLTTAEYRRAELLRPGAVLVVGSAQSGCQIAEDLLDARRDVYLAAGRCGRAPRRARGRDIIPWLEDIGWLDQRPQDVEPAMVRSAQPQISGTGWRGHTISYQSLAGRGVTLLGRFEGVDRTRLRFADDLPQYVRFADERSAQIRKMVDDHILKTGKSAPPSDPDPADEPVADPERFHGPTELDLRDRGIATVIFSTGFDGDFSYLKVPAVTARGEAVHVEGRAPVDGVWFLGLPWMRVRRSGIIPGAEIDSAILMEQIAAYLARGARSAAPS